MVLFAVGEIKREGGLQELLSTI